MLEISFTGFDGDLIKETRFAEKKREYPYLGIDEYELHLVLFIAPSTGVILCSAKLDAGDTGDFHSDWMEEDFVRVPTELRMIQTEDGNGN